MRCQAEITVSPFRSDKRRTPADDMLRQLRAVQQLQFITLKKEGCKSSANAETLATCKTHPDREVAIQNRALTTDMQSDERDIPAREG